MKSAKLFCLGCLLLVSTAAAAQASPALYSFEDVYRLALAGPVAQATGALALSTPGEAETTVRPAALDAAVQVSAVQETPATELHFTVDPLPGPQGWLLLLAGIAAAGWVAHRRLAQL